jgi:hypothetical protein
MDKGLPAAMTKSLIRSTDIHEFGAYEEAGAIVLGFRLAPTAPFESLVFQIDVAGSDQHRDQFGMYAEFDGKGVYGAVARFEYDAQLNLLGVDLVSEKSQGHASISIELPSTATTASRGLMVKMTEIFEDYPRPLNWPTP